VLNRPYHADPGLNHGIPEEFQVLGYPILSLRSIPKDREYLMRYFKEDLEKGLMKSPLELNHVWPENYSANSAQKVWGAVFASHHPNVAVLDFGLAKVLPDAPTDAPSPLADPTTLGTALGTPSYMSPEQALGRDVDERGDIYAAAVVLYKSLTGVGPFEHLGRERQMDAHVQETPLPPSEFMGERINAELDQAVLKALSTDPAERYHSAAEFRDVLIACRKRPVQSAENGEKVERGRVGKATGLFWRLFWLAPG
jgi:serine/threonine protein kinase